MTATCPYCGGPLHGEAALPPMRPRWARIYRATLEAGPKGITSEDLLVRMYADDEMPTPGGPVVLRVSICDLNKRLKSSRQRIVNAYRGCYLLVAIKEPKDEEEVQSLADPQAGYSDPKA